ncbi:MAG: hypothetical protein Q4P30_01140 [Eubacteriales bacterium]|nr:hypothetical protein [Eubacteriales bacterium]
MDFSKFKDLEKLKFWETNRKEKNTRTVLKVFAVIGILTLVGAAAYGIYKFFTPDYLDDFEDDDEFDFLMDDEDVSFLEANDEDEA